MLTWVQCMQSLLKAMNRDLQGLWIARLARDPLLVSGLLLPVWCVGARTQFLMTRCTIPTFVNVFAGNLFIRLNTKTGKRKEKRKKNGKEQSSTGWMWSLSAHRVNTTQQVHHTMQLLSRASVPRKAMPSFSTEHIHIYIYICA